MNSLELEIRLKELVEEILLSNHPDKQISICGFISNTEYRIDLKPFGCKNKKLKSIIRPLTEKELEKISMVQEFNPDEKRVVLLLCESKNKPQTPIELQTNGKVISAINKILKNKGINYAVRSRGNQRRGDWWNTPQYFFAIE